MARSKKPRGRCYICLHGFSSFNGSKWSDQYQEVIHPECEGRKPKPLNKKRSTRARKRARL